MKNITDQITTILIGGAGMLGVDQAPVIVDALSQSATNLESAATSPNWVEPVLQALIAVITVISTIFRSRKKRSLNDLSKKK